MAGRSILFPPLLETAGIVHPGQGAVSVQSPHDHT
ncbi:MAG: hypothetical protein JWL81_3335 [Verrucomicrobiales bacterium]|nr:hypothetical protein [Verrucomicrobiales bacterium]